jgi:peptidoglycan hydrolase-like protein with peptidoglycan-binding domain
MNTKPWRTAGSGTVSLAVSGIQYLLRAHGHLVTPDGSYGPATAAAVTAFQSAAGVPADGVVGPQTWPLLVVTTRSGSTGDAVRAVQQFALVPSPGVEPLVVDGSYGPVTTDRVTQFQRSWGLGHDGIAGPETWSFLSTLAPGPRPWPLVKKGATQSTNWRVLAAQHLLRARGATIAADGAFGAASGAAAQAFQQTLRATEIGTTLGQLDWPSLVLTVRPGDHGEAVKAVQTLLPGGLAVDGAFGPLTEAGVREFQSMFSPPVDGVVGPITWHALTLPIFD